MRTTPLLAALALGVLGAGSAAAQGPCTGDAAATARALYGRILHRTPDSLELRDAARQLARGRLVVELVYSLTLSREHRDSLAKLGTARAVGHLYRDLLDRDLDGAGRAQWLPVYRSGGPNAVAHGIQYGQEYREKWGAAGVPGTHVSFFCARDAMPMRHTH